MPVCPFATWQPIPPQLEHEREQPRHGVETKTQIILHTAVGNLRGSLDWWRDRFAWSVYATFFVLRSGEIVQLVDSSFKANANGSANRRAISVETEDNGHPELYPWSDKQLESLSNLARWASGEHAIPLRPCSAIDGAGIGFHTMWGNTPASNSWLAQHAKTCPGVPRIEQLYSNVLPTLGYAPAATEIDDMFARWTADPRRAATSTAPALRDPARHPTRHRRHVALDQPFSRRKGAHK